MQKWWIPVLAVVGVALGLLLIPRPDTGGDVPAHEKPGALAEEGAFPEDDFDLPLRSGKRLGDAVAAADKEGSNPYAEAARAARDTPEARASAHVQSGWAQLVRLLGEKAEGNEEAAAFKAEAETILRDLRTMRRSPQDHDWAELERRQRDLADRVRASSFADSAVTEALTHVDNQLAQYHNGGWPADAAVPEEQGEPGEPGAPGDPAGE